MQKVASVCEYCLNKLQFLHYQTVSWALSGFWVDFEGSNVSKVGYTLKHRKRQKCTVAVSSYKHKPTETDLIPILLLVVVQRVQVRYAGCLKKLIIIVIVTGTMPTVSTHTANFICKEGQARTKLQKMAFISRVEQKDSLLLLGI